MINSKETSDTLNLQVDNPKIIFGPWAQAALKSEDVPPFYINLTIHDMFLHNAMFDSGASHNLMPKIVMDNLGRDITNLLTGVKIPCNKGRHCLFKCTVRIQ